MGKRQIIQFDLVPSRMKGGKTRYYARTVPFNTVNQEYIVAEMVKRNASLSRQAIIGCLDLLGDVCEDILARGSAIETEMWSARVNLRGMFESEGDPVDPKIHVLHLKMKPSPALERRVVYALRPSRLVRYNKAPALDKLTDFMSGEDNKVLTPGGHAQVKGVRLRVDLDRSDCGYFLVPQGELAKKLRPIRLENVLKMTDRTLRLRLPDSIPPGRYLLEGRRQYADGTENGRLKAVLTVG